MFSPLSSAILSATAIALIRRGCVHTILHPGPKVGSSSRNCGTWVDFPHPVSPETKHACSGVPKAQRTRKHGIARGIYNIIVGRGEEAERAAHGVVCCCLRSIHWKNDHAQPWRRSQCQLPHRNQRVSKQHHVSRAYGAEPSRTFHRYTHAVHPCLRICVSRTQKHNNSTSRRMSRAPHKPVPRGVGSTSRTN